MGRYVRFEWQGNDVEIRFKDFGLLQIQRVGREIERSSRKTERLQKQIDILSSSLEVKETTDLTMESFERVENEIGKLEDCILKCDENTSKRIDSIVVEFVNSITLNDKDLTAKEKISLPLSLKMFIFRSLVDQSDVEDTANFQPTFGIC